MDTKTVQVKKMEMKKQTRHLKISDCSDNTTEFSNIVIDISNNSTHEQQVTMVNRIFLNDTDFPEYQKIKALITKKISGYKQQDIKKKRETTNIICFDDTIEKLLSCKLKCYYCSTPVLIIYDYIRQEDQWSLERINNKEPHTQDNVEVACLKCNLKRRLMDDKRFAFSKKGGFGNVKKVF
tara:strand:+ start:529 stop:1071 length:543 start_codon:yes stop_codon:yes gene_type:complete